MMFLPIGLQDALIRHKTAMHELPLDRFSIRVARTAAEYEDAFSLVHAAYVFMGIQEHPSPGGLRIVAQHPLRESTVWVAYEGSTLVATMTLIQDSSVGLPLDKDYANEIGALRARPGSCILEYASLAVVQRYQSTGVMQLLSMAVTNFACNYLGATHVVIGIHPRAIPFYRALFTFEPLGKAQTHSQLAAPVVGLVQDMVAFKAFMRDKYRKPMSSGRLPVEHFFGEPPSCIQMPPRDLDRDALMRWKLSREVFQDLFIRRSNYLATLTEDVREQLGEQRTRETLVQAEEQAFVSEHVASEILRKLPSS